MQIIIPMTGYGSRFVNAGYKELKPFISVMGRPILEWIVRDMYPGEENIVFICREEHLQSVPKMRERLLQIAPGAKIFSISDWVKEGPVVDVLRASEVIREEEPVIINYCDFYMSWDWSEMKRKLLERGCDGSVPCYTGFHPHLLPRKNLYASCRTDEQGDLMEIREKYSFEEDKMKGKHSPGVYYFRTGKLLKQYCGKLVAADCRVNGEFYASLPYNFMVQDGLRVWVPTDIRYFCQWGTPEDLKEFEYWTGVVRGRRPEEFRECDPVNILIPMAGEGRRFRDVGYQVSKPAIPTYDRHTGGTAPMVVCATKDLPGVGEKGANVLYVDRDFHEKDGTEALIRETYPECRFLTVDRLTEGQASTCLLAKDQIDNDQPLLIAGCDNGMEYDPEAFQRASHEADVLVFTYRHNEAVLENPNAYGWVETEDQDRVKRVSVKKPLSDHPMEDHAIVATFWFRQGSMFVQAAEEMIRENDRVNGEFYVDQAINYAVKQGRTVKVFEIDRYICWGTPRDYEAYQKTFEYWRGFWNERNGSEQEAIPGPTE